MNSNRFLLLKNHILFFIVCLSLISFLSCGDNSSDVDNPSDKETIQITPVMGTQLIEKDHIIANVNDVVSLNATPSGEVSSYNWTIETAPEESLAVLSSNSIWNPAIAVDKEGFYIINLTVTYRNGYAEMASCYIGTPTVIHYIRAGAGGNNDGSNWLDAWTQLPNVLQRGHTYYIADGNYGYYIFDDEESGTVPIYIKKAVISDHGPASGWSDAYGAGQAVFQVSDPSDQTPISFRTSYWNIDGQVGSGTSGHGFKFYNTSTNSAYVVLVGDINASGSELSHIILKHSEIQHKGPDNTDGSGRGFQVHSTAALSNSLLQYCYIHDIPGISIYYVNTTNITIEYCYIARNHSDPILHGEGIQTGGTYNNYNTVRYTTWEDIEGTAVIVAGDNWDIYGNLFFYSNDYPNSGQSGSGVGQGVVSATKNNIRFFNNTIFGMTGVNQIHYYPEPNNESYNNIWVNCARGRWINVTADYNYYYNIADHGGYLDDLANYEMNSELGTSDPFLNSTTYDFHLSNETQAGIDLDFPYNKDMDGKTRGSDGTWTRGAYEY